MFLFSCCHVNYSVRRSLINIEPNCPTTGLQIILLSSQTYLQMSKCRSCLTDLLNHLQNSTLYEHEDRESGISGNKEISDT